jgi:hypothetical protein
MVTNCAQEIIDDNKAQVVKLVCTGKDIDSLSADNDLLG